MLDNLYLTEKLTAAKLPKGCLTRRMLINTFEQKSDKRVIFVSAPAGYGKTVSTQLWLSNSGRKAIWIWVDRYDNSPSIFYKLFCAGILSAQPENAAMAEIFKSPSFAHSPVEHTIMLLSEFMPDNNKYVIVLDDAHNLTSKDLLKSNLLIRKRLPLSFITVALTRNEISEETFFWEFGEDGYGIITQDDLKFSTDEVRQFFIANGRDMTFDEAENIRTFTGGWPIGINALSLSGETVLGERSVQILDNYIKTQIWDKWTKELREFMIKTAIVDEMPISLCEQITGRSDSREILEQLLDANIFISKATDKVYVYHHLFLEFLRNQAEKIYVNKKEIYSLATYYYIGSGDLFLARSYALKSGYPDAMMNVIRQLSGYGRATINEVVTYSKMYEDSSEGVCARAPFIFGTLMWENYLLGNAAKAEYYMDKLYEFLPVIAKDFPQDLESVLINLFLDHRSSLAELIDSLSNFLPKNDLYDYPRSPTLTHEMPFMHRSSRDYSELTDEFIFSKFKEMYGWLFKGNMDIIMWAIKSGLYLEKNMHEESLDAALKAKSLENSDTSCELRFCNFVHLASAYYAMRNEKYKEILIDAEHFINEARAQYLLPNFMAFKHRILLMDGDKKAATDWLNNYFVLESDTPELYKIYQYFTTAKAYTVLGRTDSAMNYVCALKRLARDFNRPLDIAEAGVMQSILEWWTGKKAEAQQTLELALLEIERYDYVRIIAMEGAAILPVLRRLAAKIKKENYNGAIKASFIHKVTLSAYEQSKIYKGIAVNIRVKSIKLSRRQKQILVMLSEGSKYTEIMEATGLTIHTIKSHTSAIYTKLDVHNSMDAVVKARELGILG